MAEYSAEERLKWSLLDHVAARQPLSFAYGLVLEMPNESQSRGDEVVRSAVLELLDEGLIYAFRATWDEAMEAPDDALVRASTDEVIADLDVPVSEMSGEIFLDITELGDERLRPLPPEAFLDPRQSYLYER